MSKITDALSILLADTFTLYLKTHKYHWNVEGSDFYELHIFFEKLYNEIWEATDEIAERIRSLGEYAPGSFQEFAKLTNIKDAATKLKGEAMIKDMLAGHEIVIKSAQKVLALCDKSGDAATADFVTGRIEAHQKNAWMLRSYLR